MASNEKSEIFDAHYFAHGCGAPYERNEHWLSFFGKVADRIQRDIQPATVLDAGCALGFLVEMLRDRGIEAWGLDISKYAIENAHAKVEPYVWVGSVTEPFPDKYDLITCIEVLEHLPKPDSEEAVENLCRHSDNILFSSTPLDYKETTHFNVQPPEYWAELFARQGFFRDVDFDATFITPWAVSFRKRSEPMHRILRDYERRFWLLWKENTDTRSLMVNMRDKIANLEEETRLLQYEKESTEAALNAQIRELSKEVKRLSEQILGWHKHWEQIQSGMSWRIVQAMIRMKPRIAPSNSRREKLLVWIFERTRSLVRGMRDNNLKSTLLDTEKDIGTEETGKTATAQEKTLHKDTSQASLNIALYTSDDWTGACSHLRIIGPAQHRNSGITVLEGIRWEEDPKLFFPETAEVVLIQRDFPDQDELFSQVIDWAKENHKPIVYEIDDLLIELPEVHPERDYYAKAREPMLRALINADAVIVSTQALAEYACPFNPNTWVLPNYLDDNIWAFQQTLPKNKSGPVVIGYMGGITKTHLPDLEMIRPVLMRLLKRYGDKLQMRFWGLVPPELERLPNVTFQLEKFPNYTEFARYFSRQSVDLFIAPLLDNLFNRCKSPIKFIEYSSLGIPGVYSRIEPYESVVSHGQNGFLANTDDEWEECLIQLIEDVNLRQALGKSAYQHIGDYFLMSENATQWGTVYRTALSMVETMHTAQTHATAQLHFEQWFKNKG